MCLFTKLLFQLPRIEEKLAYTYGDLVADFGGYLGLLLGSSIITLYDVTVRLLCRCSYWYFCIVDIHKYNKEIECQKKKKTESAFHPKRLIRIMFALLLDIEFYGVSSRDLTIVIKKWQLAQQIKTYKINGLSLHFITMITS